MEVRALWYTAFVGGLWLLALPAALVADAGGSIFPSRGSLAVVVAMAVAAAGLGLVLVGARILSVAGVGVFGVAPGPVLVTDGVYAHVRNPVDIGILLLSVVGWIALQVDLMWVIPAGTLAWLVGGVEPYEDRRLLEEFGEDFETYRGRVRRWFPRSQPAR